MVGYSFLNRATVLTTSGTYFLGDNLTAFRVGPLDAWGVSLHGSVITGYLNYAVVETECSSECSSLASYWA